MQTNEWAQQRYREALEGLPNLIFFLESGTGQKSWSQCVKEGDEPVSRTEIFTPLPYLAWSTSKTKNTDIQTNKKTKLK